VGAAFLFSTLVYAQNFQPRNSAEAHAWRLHDEYVASEKKQRELESQIRVKAIETGVPGGSQNDRAALELERLFRNFAAEIQFQQRLEQAWNEKFYPHYGELKDTANRIYDVSIGTEIDLIQFRLIHFPLYPNDGTYNGTIADVPGEINLVVQGTTVVGTITGAYFYRAGNLPQSEQFTASIDGTLSDAGILQASLWGSAGNMQFTGSLKGKIIRGLAQGTWAIDVLTVQCGTFKATRPQ
jgi:hypothetical protein